MNEKPESSIKKPESGLERKESITPEAAAEKIAGYDTLLSSEIPRENFTDTITEAYDRAIVGLGKKIEMASGEERQKLQQEFDRLESHRDGLKGLEAQQTSEPEVAEKTMEKGKESFLEKQANRFGGWMKEKVAPYRRAATRMALVAMTTFPGMTQGSAPQDTTDHLPQKMKVEQQDTQQKTAGFFENFDVDHRMFRIDENGKEVANPFGFLIAPINVESGKDIQKTEKATMDIPYQYAENFDKAHETNAGDKQFAVEKMEQEMKDEIKHQISTWLQGDGVYNATHEGKENLLTHNTELRNMTVNLKGFSSPEGSTYESVLPGNIDQSNIDLAKMRVCDVEPLVMEAIQEIAAELGIDPESIMVNLDFEEVQFSDREVDRLLGLAERMDIAGESAEEKIFNLVQQYNDHALELNSHEARMMADIIDSKRGIELEIEAEGTEKQRTVVPIPIFLLMGGLALAAVSRRRRKEEEEGQKDRMQGQKDRMLNKRGIMQGPSGITDKPISQTETFVSAMERPMGMTLEEARAAMADGTKMVIAGEQLGHVYIDRINPQSIEFKNYMGKRGVVSASALQDGLDSGKYTLYTAAGYLALTNPESVQQPSQEDRSAPENLPVDNEEAASPVENKKEDTPEAVASKNQLALGMGTGIYLDAHPEDAPVKQEQITISQEEYDGLKRDIEYINRTIQGHRGNIQINESALYSDYARQRVADLSSFPDQKTIAGFNKVELQQIGDEIERLLSKATVAPSKKDLPEDYRQPEWVETPSFAQGGMPSQEDVQAALRDPFGDDEDDYTMPDRDYMQTRQAQSVESNPTVQDSLDTLRTAARAAEYEGKTERLREINKDIEALQAQNTSEEKQEAIKARIKKMMSSAGATNDVYDTIENGQNRGMNSVR